MRAANSPSSATVVALRGFGVLLVVDSLRRLKVCATQRGLFGTFDNARHQYAILSITDQGGIASLASEKELRLDVENTDLRRLLAQSGIDAAEHKLLESLQRLLLEELHHRIKNVLATVMAITSQTLRHADGVEAGRVAIENRLLALGRVHDLVLRTKWTSATLTSIVETAIAPFDKGGRFSVQSPDIEVSPAAVLPLAMILNELCTNAVKHGALSNNDGRVTISAAIDASNSDLA